MNSHQAQTTCTANNVGFGYTVFNQKLAQPLSHQNLRPKVIAVPALQPAAFSHIKNLMSSSKMQPPKLPSASAQPSFALETGNPRDRKSVLGYCQKGESTKSQKIQACFPDWKQLSFMALCKNTFSLLPLGPYQESWNSIFLLPTCSGHWRVKFYSEGAESYLKWIQHNQVLPWEEWGMAGSFSECREE